MPIVLDETTRAEYLAQTLASSRASLVVSALTGTVTCEVYDGSNVLRASGTMASPWATASGSTITVGEVNATGISVTSGGAPDSNWYCQFRSTNGRFVRGTFGVSTDTADFKWSLSSFQSGSRGTLGTVTLTADGAADSTGPVVVSGPTISAFRGSASATGAVLQITPSTWINQLPVSDYPIQRDFGWQRDGVDVSAGLCETTEAAGTYRAWEEAWFVATPTAKSRVYSPSIVVSGSRDPLLVYRDNLTYRGAIKFPEPSGAANDQQKYPYGGFGLTFNPAGNSGSGSLFAMGHIPAGGNSYTQLCGEFDIPSPSTDSATVPTASMLSGTTLRDPIEGQQYTSGVTGGAENIVSGLLVHSGLLLATLHCPYASDTNASWIYRRPLNLSTTGSVEGPFRVTDSAKIDNPRYYAGYLAHVPTTSVAGLNPQTALGGPVLCGLTAGSIVSNTSDGPALATFDPAAFTAAGSKSRRGTAQGGSSSTIQLDAGASSTTDHYVGCYVVKVGSTQVRRITAYNGSTKVATVDSTWTAPTASTQFVVVPQIDATMTAGYPDGTLQHSYYGTFPTIWNWNGEVGGVAVPNGTRSVLAFGLCGNGVFYYGTHNQPATLTTPEVIIYDPDGAGQGEHSRPYLMRVWAYDLLELQAVRTGAVGHSDVRPYAVWNLRLPFAASATFPSIRGVAYDPTTRRIYLSVAGAYAGARPAIHVFEVDNAVAV